MASMKTLAKDTAIYGLSSIVGRFLNYLLVPLYTHYMPQSSGEYGESSNIYAFVAFLLPILTFGMETTLFRFANKEGERPDTVFATGFTIIALLCSLFLGALFFFIEPISQSLGYDAHPEYLEMMGTVVVLDALQALPFSYLRFQKRAIKFASLKLLFILFNIALNVLYFVVLGKTHVYFIFLINLWCTAAITLFFVPDLLRIRWRLNWRLTKSMLSYSWPLLILGIAGILNQCFDKMAFPLVSDAADAKQQLGIYGACVKIAMIMAMITQAFRYAYEPLVFSIAKEKNSKDTYAMGMKYFIIFTLLAFLCVEAYMPLLQHIIGADYREGLKVVPIVMAAEIMMGVLFNLSFWYKLIDQTIWGAVISVTSCVVLVVVNLVFIPTYGYMACAWGGVAGYGTGMVMSYVLGQWKNPIRYPMGKIIFYTLMTAAFYLLMLHLPPEWGTRVHMGINTLLILFFLLCVYLFDIKPMRKHQQ